MSRRGQGKVLADEMLIETLCKAGVSVAEAQRALAHPMAAKEIAYAFKGLPHRYDTVTMMTQAARVLSPAEIASCFAAGVGEDVSVSSWLDRPLQPFEQSGRPLKFLAKRYKEAAIQSGDMPGKERSAHPKSRQGLVHRHGCTFVPTPLTAQPDEVRSSLR